MFLRNNKTRAQAQEARSEGAAPKAVPSIISTDLVLEGNIGSSGEVQVDGTVCGDIQCKTLIVGVKGSVTGDVIAQTVRMHGTIKGRVRAKSVFLASTAHMSGGVEHESLAIEPGAYIEGHCKRITEPLMKAPAEEGARRSGSAKSPTRASVAIKTPPRIIPRKPRKENVAVT